MPVASPFASVAPQAEPSAAPEALKFYPVKKFSAVIHFALDFEHLFVSDGTNNITFTADKGLTWTTIEKVGTLPIKSMFWLDQKTGWVGTKSGTVLKVTIKDGVAVTEVQDPQTTNDIVALYFINESLGFAIDAHGRAHKTQDGGQNWDEGIQPYGEAISASEEHNVARYSSDTFIYNVHINSWGLDKTFLFSDGVFKQLIADDAVYAKAIPVGKSLYLSKGNGPGDGTWYAATNGDLSNTRKFGPSLKTPSQILRDYQLTSLSGTDDNEIVGLMRDNRSNRTDCIIISKDGGQTWSEPIRPEFVNGSTGSISWLKAFGSDRIWAYYYGTLYRAGK
jgi:hypothetical protein